MSGEIARRRSESLFALRLCGAIDLDRNGSFGSPASFVEVFAPAKMHHCDFAGELPTLCEVGHAGLYVDLDVLFERVFDVGEAVSFDRNVF
jgi:hypothetical protein